MTIVLAILIGAGLFTALWILGTLIYTGVPYVKTPHSKYDLLLAEMDISSADTVYDLGCGDADLLIQVSSTTGASCIGYEISPIAYLRAWFKIRRSGLPIRLHFGNFRKARLANATVVFCFLAPLAMPLTSRFLKTHARKGARIFSYGFPLPGWSAIRTVSTSDRPSGSRLYVYRQDG